MRINLVFLAGSILSLTAVSVLAEEGVVRKANPIFAKQPAWAVKKYGGLGLFFPERADRGQVVSGTAEIECTLAANGFLNDCRIISATPASCPFGYAAQGMAERRALSAAPRLVDGQPIDGETVRLEVAFGHPERGGRPDVCPSP